MKGPKKGNEDLTLVFCGKFKSHLAKTTSPKATLHRSFFSAALRAPGAVQTRIKATFGRPRQARRESSKPCMARRAGGQSGRLAGWPSFRPGGMKVPSVRPPPPPPPFIALREILRRRRRQRRMQGVPSRMGLAPIACFPYRCRQVDLYNLIGLRQTGLSS